MAFLIEAGAGLRGVDSYASVAKVHHSSFWRNPSV